MKISIVTLGVLAICGAVGCGGSTGGEDAGFDAGLDASLDGSLDSAIDAGPTLRPPGVPVGTLPPPACDDCHGDETSPAPPLDLAGHTATRERGVGAHRSHLSSSDWHRQVQCEDCHLVPTEVDDPGHIDTPLPAELTWGTVPLQRGAEPSFDGTSCSDVYCHGSRLDPGGTNTTPKWTVVDGTQGFCGTCHSLPPGGTHPKYDGCQVCHPTIDASWSIVAPERHIDGQLDLEISDLTCTSCHGSDGIPAPPRDTSGRTSTEVRSVGAHRSHLAASDWHRQVLCEDCHLVPDLAGAGVFATGHIDTPRPAELTWGALATTDGATPVWDGTTCSGVYCHGETLLPGGSNTTPEWTTVDGTQAACGTCHSLPPGGSHPSLTQCSICHPSVDESGAIIDPARHIDGVVEVISNHPDGWRDPSAHGLTADRTGLSTCQACHGADLTGGLVGVSCESCHPGWQTNCTFCHGGTDNMTGAPAAAVDGRTGRLTLAVGAHMEHVTWHGGWDCTRCHVKPTSALSPGHIDGDGRAEVVFDGKNPVATYDPVTGVCANLYCHGDAAHPASAEWDTDPPDLPCSDCHFL
ncbi:MAG: CxxxxCH/CxxCH domain-containing protein [Deltaproteobacteria bacterium]|nr:CxxxxCH/CxxCH domain-containing protein [Deltaproteobacteria bacterium]